MLHEKRLKNPNQIIDAQEWKEFNDEEIESLLIVTREEFPQPPILSKSSNKSENKSKKSNRAQNHDEINELINDALYFYELDLRSGKTISKKVFFIR